MEVSKFNLAWLVLTYSCNNKCKWCYASSNNYETMKGKSLDINRLPGIINLLNELKIRRVTLIGGEPTVYAGIEKVISDLSEKRINAGMVSNGRKFRDMNFCQELKAMGLNHATFSIEGSNPAIHDFTTEVPGSYSDTIQGIKNAMESGITVTTNTVISSINLYDLEANVDNLSSCGIKDIGFNIAGVCLTSQDNERYSVNIKEAVNQFEKAYIHARNKGVKARLVTPMPKCFFSQELLEEFNREHVIGNSPCQMSHGKNFVIDQNGDIIPCTHLTGYLLFNIFENGAVINANEFLIRYNSLSSLEFRDKITRYASSKCEGCKESCSGGCPLYWIKLIPDQIIRGNEKLKEPHL